MGAGNRNAHRTLHIVGGADTTALELNRRSMETLHCESRLEIVEDETHLFEEPGALTEVATLGRDWFVDHLPDRTISPVEGTQE